MEFPNKFVSNGSRFGILEDITKDRGEINTDYQEPFERRIKGKAGSEGRSSSNGKAGGRAKH